MNSISVLRSKQGQKAIITFAIVFSASIAIGVLMSYRQNLVAIVVGIVLVTFLGIWLSRKLWYGIVLIMAIAPFNDLQRIPNFEFLSLAKILGLILLILWSFSLVLERRRLSIPTEIKLLLGLILVMFISTIQSFDVIGGFNAWLSLVSYLLFFVVIIDQVKTARQVELLIKMFIVVAGVIGIIAMLQIITQRSLFPDLLDRETISASSVAIGRAIGSSTNPNSGAMVPMFGLPLAFAINSSKQSRLWRMCIYFASIFMGIHLLLSFSRSAFLGVFSSTIFLIILVKKKRSKLLGQLVLTIIALVLIINLLPGNSANKAIQERFETFLDPSEENVRQLSIFKTASAFVVDHWIFGVGMGGKNFGYAMAQYTGFSGTSHNMIYAILGAGGILALFIYIWLFVLIFYRGSKTLRVISNETDRLIHAGLFSSVVAWQIHGQFHSSYSWIVGWIIVALLTSLTRLINLQRLSMHQ